MIGIILNDNGYEQDIRELLMAFFPGEPFVHQWQEGLDVWVEGTVREDRQGFAMQVCRREPEYRASRPISVDYDNRLEAKNRIKQELYRILSDMTGRQLPWGSLTGIRPVKIAMTRLEEGFSEEAIRSYMKETYFASDAKIDLSIRIARRERELLAGLDYREGYSLYVGIPFCPTTCLYSPSPPSPWENGRERQGFTWTPWRRSWIMWPGSGADVPRIRSTSAAAPPPPWSRRI